MEVKNSIDYTEWLNLNMMDKIHKLFFVNIENISDNAFKRLQFIETRNYYEGHILFSMKKSL